MIFSLTFYTNCRKTPQKSPEARSAKLRILSRDKITGKIISRKEEFEQVLAEIWLVSSEIDGFVDKQLKKEMTDEDAKKWQECLKKMKKLKEQKDLLSASSEPLEKEKRPENEQKKTAKKKLRLEGRDESGREDLEDHDEDVNKKKSKRIRKEEEEPEVRNEIPDEDGNKKKSKRIRREEEFEEPEVRNEIPHSTDPENESQKIDSDRDGANEREVKKRKTVKELERLADWKVK
jgi:hypothetical protein